MTADTPAKRRDCLALLCGLPVGYRGQKALVEAGLAKGQPAPGKSRKLRLTKAGRVLAFTALTKAPQDAFCLAVEREIRLQFDYLETPKTRTAKPLAPGRPGVR